MKIKSKIILDLCGGTGAWSRPYAEAGYDVRLITLPEFDVCNFRPPENVYGILAAPPCREFSLAKGNRPRNLQAGMKIVTACLQIIWLCRCRDKTKFWAMENPVGLLRQFLGMPYYTFEQWQFGEFLIKRTDIFGYFKKPVPTVKTKTLEEMTIRYPKGKTNNRRWAKPRCPKEYKNLELTRSDLRAITPSGFAKAFFKVNQ